MMKLVILFVLGVLVSPHLAYANTLEQQINHAKDTLAQISARHISQSQQLSHTLTTIATIESQLSHLTKDLHNTQTHINTLAHDITQLDEQITKRTKPIAKQAQFLQTQLDVDNFLFALLSAPTLIDGLRQFDTLTKLSSAAIEQLKKQQQDKALLKEKQAALEKLALHYADQSHALTTKKLTLLTTLTQLHRSITQLDTDKTQLQQQIKQLHEQTANTYISPLQNPIITSPFGISRTFTLANGQPYSDIHNGIDLVNGNNNAPIQSIANGTVIWAGYQAAGGHGVIMKLTDGLYAYYFHLSHLAVTIGQTVSQGQMIGTIGSSGLYVTGTHLHLGLSTQLYDGYVDPAHYIDFNS